jgi:uncharacterized protein (TIGR00661 family)
MRILYAIQGTGNGHISRAKEIVPLLRKRCETDVLISGDQADIELPFNPVYKVQGLTFTHGKNGGVDFRKTYKKANTKRFLNEIKDLPVEDYDFVINDFEPVSAWACYQKKVSCIALSHQSSLLDKNTPRPAQKDVIGSFVLKNYAPASHHFGFHFSRYSKNIYTPVIRKEIRKAEKTDDGHYVVYLPAFDDKFLMELLEKIPDVKWEVFSKYENKNCPDHIVFKKVNDLSFTRSLISCRGILCGAGFETPSEALFLGKKLLVVPMKNQYEQQYNATALKSMGVPVIKKLSSAKADKIKDWITSDYRVEITYPDLTDRIINKIFEMYVEEKLTVRKKSGKPRLTPGKNFLKSAMKL